MLKSIASDGFTRLFPEPKKLNNGIVTIAGKISNFLQFCMIISFKRPLDLILTNILRFNPQKSNLN